MLVTQLAMRQFTTIVSKFVPILQQGCFCLVFIVDSFVCGAVNPGPITRIVVSSSDHSRFVIATMKTELQLLLRMSAF